MNQAYKSKKIEPKTFEDLRFYTDFQQVSQILETIKTWTTDEIQTVWAGFDNGKEFLDELNADIEKIKSCDFATLDKINIEFSPTSSYQEIALSNGWADEFLKLAVQFDKLYEKMKVQNKNLYKN